MSADAVLRRLRETGRVRSNEPRLIPLNGGVSSDIWLVVDGTERYVVKRARPRLAVRDEWLADPARNATESACLKYLHAIRPDAVPGVLFEDRELGLFGMEYFDGRYLNWKTELLAGRVREADAARAGALLGAVHRASWMEPRARCLFATWDHFYSLRAEPYLLTTGDRHPSLREYFRAEVERLRSATLALVHGDYSPKNILLGEGRLVLLDCEVAWFGDPAFDVAFALNHLFLKSMHRPDHANACLGAADALWSAYRGALGSEYDEGFEVRTSRLLLLLMLARIDGKSPVEYLEGALQKDMVRGLVAELLPAGVFQLAAIRCRWENRLARM